MKIFKIILSCVLSIIMILSLCACEDSNLSKAKKYFSQQQYAQALDLFKLYKDSCGTSSSNDTINEVNGYIYACAYYLLSNYLDSHSGSQTCSIGTSSSTQNITHDCKIVLEQEGNSIYMGHEDQTCNGSKGTVKFNNFYLHIPSPDAGLIAVPDEIQWNYIQSDVLNEFTELAKASGKVKPSDWFDLKKENGYLCAFYNLERQFCSGDETTVKINTTAGFSNLMEHLDSIFDSFHIGITYTDFGFENYNDALNNFDK